MVSKLWCGVLLGAVVTAGFGTVHAQSAGWWGEAYDVAPKEWDTEEKGSPCNRSAVGADGIVMAVCITEDPITVHHSVCVVDGTHNPDPNRFPIADATGKTHCILLLRDREARAMLTVRQ